MSKVTSNAEPIVSWLSQSKLLKPETLLLVVLLGGGGAGVQTWLTGQITAATEARFQRVEGQLSLIEGKIDRLFEAYLQERAWRLSMSPVHQPTSE